ncbi:response regulator transcription factor [candidate division WWE3 bacterium]|uniref:Response regulator transcription factor n=1 Tax=candidate division WWE3 bacterium TaxID=2053526 RepID=A0A7X9DLB6_UNCKA|nr:response regulator transcription factor [candidate division WWE3 bacterium]
MRVLFVEEDLGYINALMGELSRDYLVDIAHTGEDGAYLSEINDYDVILVDDKLPDCSGTDVCCLTRNSQCVSPIILLSANYSETKIIECLENGVDLCFPRNVSPDRIKQGVSALIKKNNILKNEPVKICGYYFDLCNKIVRYNNEELKLRRKEYDILEYLVLKRGRVVSKEEILEHMWTNGIYLLSNTVEVHITNIRNVIEKPFKRKLIETVRGFGYRIKVEKQAKNSYHTDND